MSTVSSLITCPVCSQDFRVHRDLNTMDGSTILCPNPDCTAHLCIFSEVGKPIQIVPECDTCGELIRGEVVRHGTETLCGLCADDRLIERSEGGLAA